jgi:hypothetical protein
MSMKLEEEILMRLEWGRGSRSARFFLTQYTKTGKNYHITTKLPNDHKVYQMAVIYSYTKYTNIFHYKALKNLPKLRFLV